MKYPNIDPVIFEIYGPIAIRWYSLAYIIGIISANLFMQSNLKKFLKKSQIENLMNYVIVGLIIGARIGFVLFYDPFFYFENPNKILKVWEGGMAFHGGLLGIVTGVYLYCKKNNKMDILPTIFDLGSIIAPLGIMFGRFANFINAELYGTQTNLPIGMVFPSDPMQIPRHPTQLYEAFLEGFILFILMFYLKQKKNILEKKWLASAYFLLFYGTSRFLIEFLKEPDESIGYILKYFTMGHVLCFGMILGGYWMKKYQIKK